jgi:Cys-tRNA(Pro)/Cys-tRNA(Cys) deacylase
MTAHPRIEDRLRQCGADYRIREHAGWGIAIKSPRDFAHVLGYEIERITKSLLLRERAEAGFMVAVCSANKRLDLAAICKLLDCGRLELATGAELTSKTGYPPTGVSPVGVDGVRVIVDEGLLTYETILIGGGVVGVEIEMAPGTLIDCSRARVGRIVK